MKKFLIFDLKTIKERGLNVKTLWDLFMILIAVVNLTLILFDLTYLSMRPFYIEHFTEIVLKYDEVKGIEPHRQTQQIIADTRRFEKALEDDPDSEITEKLRGSLIEQSIDMVKSNPFELAGLHGRFEQLKHHMKEFMKKQGAITVEDGSTDAFRAFYKMPAGRSEAHFSFFREKIEPLLDMNYYRHRDLSGGFVDNFILLDLPFLIFFAVEFLIRWFLSIRRREHIAWFLFPFYNWYDVLGLLPFAGTRIFRLFRVISIYVRLHKSEFTNIGQDFISRWFRKYSQIISEELADMVAIRILSEAQEEVARGASLNVFIKAVEPRRAEIKATILKYLRQALENRDRLSSLRDLLSESLEDSARQVPSLKVVPDFLKVRLTREIGLSVFDAVNSTLTDEVTCSDGRDNVSYLVDYTLDEILNDSEKSELNILTQQIIIDILENIKEAVAVKKWATPEMQQMPFNGRFREASRRLKREQGVSDS